MTILIFLLILFTEACTVVGQIFFKHAMSSREGRGLKLTAGIVAKAVNFFLWNGLLSKYDLSFLYPFDGLNLIMLVVAASIFLKERMTPSLWAGVTLVCAGVFLISRS